MTGQVLATFRSLDPITQLPPDVLTGFLPPEDGTGRGQGFFNYVVRPDAGLPTGSVIRNVARIQFDFGEIIDTNQVDPHDPSKGTDPAREALVTLDASPPTSGVEPLPEFSASTFTVRWAGADDAGGSGVASFDVFVSTDGGPFALWLAGATGTSASFAGAPGHTYGFYSVATDNVGHAQPAPAGAQAVTAVAGAALTLRKSGADVVLVDDRTANVLLRRAAGDPAAVLIPGGDGDDQLTIDFAPGGFFTLPPGSAFDAGGGSDRLVASLDGDMTANADALTVGGFRLGFTGLERLDLVGGAGNNVLDASAFLGSATLDGGAGNDVLRGGPGDDFLTGGPGNDVIAGNGGLDILVESGDTNMALSNAAFRGGALLGSDRLSGVEAARLSGGPGNNVISAATFTRQVWPDPHGCLYSKG
jgi:Ca2+-binding RTX toxin-like protein